MADRASDSAGDTDAALVGRSRERAVLRDALAASLAGRGSLVLIGGAAGIGKTTLAEWLLAEAARQGALVLVGRCYDLTETPPYGPWRELLAGYPQDGALPTIPATFVRSGGEGRGTSATSQEALFAQVRDFLVAVAAARPLVVLLDDLHWADPASLELLRFLGRQLGQHRLLIIATYRADELTRRHPLYTLLPTVVREAQATRLDLRPLTRDDLAALVNALYPLAEADAARLASHLHDYAEGNPFYVGELFRALEVEGLLRPAVGASWHVGDLTVVRVPPLVQQLIDARLARLGDEAVRLLGIAALIGPIVPPDLWAAVAETSEEALLDTIERAVEARVLVESLADGGYRFAHALIRGVLYQGLLLPRRRAWHRRIGEALAAIPSPDPDRVAHHFRRAGDPRAAEWLVRAGELAWRSYAWVTAAERYEAALVLLAQQGDVSRNRVRLQHTLSLLLRYADRPRSIELLAESTALAAENDYADLAAAARFDRGQLLCMSQDYAAGLPELRAALPTLETLTPTRLASLPTAVILGLRPGEAYHRGVLLGYLAHSGYLAEAEEVAGEALSLRPEISHRALGAMGTLYSWRGEPTLAARAFAAAIAGTRASGQHREVAMRLLFFGNFLAVYRTDDLEARAALTTEVAAVLPTAREADHHLTATQMLVGLRLIEGAWAELAHWGAMYPHRDILAYLLELARLQGDIAAARARVRALLPAGPLTPPGTTLLQVGLLGTRVATELALDAGDLAEARAWLEARDHWLAWSGAVLGQAEGQLGWAAYHRAAGDLAAARACAECALGRATEPRQPLALISTHRFLGELDTAASQYDDAQSHLDAALTLAAACAAPYERALTLLSLAELRLAAQDRDGARAALAEARALLDPLAARPALARADTLAAKLTVPAANPPVAPALPAGLSAREAEVLRLVAQGLSNAQAAERLFLSPRTVDQHLRSIYGKLGVENRAAATRFAIEHGLA